MVDAFVAGTGRLGQDKEENGQNSLFFAIWPLKYVFGV
jgi:hypothetical protein